MQDIASMTGAEQHKKAPEGYQCNQIVFNGKDGKFYYQDLLNKKDGEKPDKKEIGVEVPLVFLKIRRKMSYFSSANDKFVQTNEHNFKDDTVFLFGPNVRGKASDLREKYPLLRVQQVVYCLYGEEVVKLIVKGASLGSQAENQGTKFYEYLQSFGKDEHVHEHITNVFANTEKGKLGEYGVMNFQRGDKLNEEQQKVANEYIVKLHEIITAQDTYYKAQDEQEIIKEESNMPETAEYPDEEINSDDIPF